MKSSKRPGKGSVRTGHPGCGQALSVRHLPPDAIGKHDGLPQGTKRTKGDVPVPGLEPGQQNPKFCELPITQYRTVSNRCQQRAIRCSHQNTGHADLALSTEPDLAAAAQPSEPLRHPNVCGLVYVDAEYQGLGCDAGRVQELRIALISRLDLPSRRRAIARSRKRSSSALVLILEF
jgi:hypothetical protein